MANLSGYELTLFGKKLQAKTLAGNCSIQITKVKLGATPIKSLEDLMDKNDLIGTDLKILDIIECTTDNNICKISTSITNSGQKKNFPICQIGIFAKGTSSTNEEVPEGLYAVAYDTMPDILPADNHSTCITKQFSINLLVDNATSISVTTSPARMITTDIFNKVIFGLAKKGDISADISAHNASPVAHNDIRQLIAKAVASATPVGTITPYAGQSAPDGYLACDGSAVSRTTYAALFKVISTTYGSGDGSTFNLPNLQGRTIIGVSSSHTLATTGGEETHTLTENEMPSHSHSGSTDASGEHYHSISGISVYMGANLIRVRDSHNPNISQQNDMTTNTSGSHSHSVYINSAGGGQSHNNMQPYIALNYIIKY